MGIPAARLRLATEVAWRLHAESSRGRRGRENADADAEVRMPGVFTTLNRALSEANDGDVIYIRHGDISRDVVVSPIEMKPGISVTLKPDTDYQPRLVLNKAFRDKETSVFKVREGKLEIESMEIVLDPGQDAEVTQSIV